MCKYHRPPSSTVSLYHGVKRQNVTVHFSRPKRVESGLKKVICLWFSMGFVPLTHAFSHGHLGRNLPGDFFSSPPHEFTEQPGVPLERIFDKDVIILLTL